MKKAFILIAALCIMLCGCDSQDTVSQNPTINKTQLNLTVGQSERLVISNATNIEWSSDNPKVARVLYGAVTALSEGKTVIFADTGNEVFECVVVVSGNTTESEPTTESSQHNPSSPQITSSIIEDVLPDNQSQNNISQPTHEENVQATQNAALALVERLTDEKYDKSIADLTDECNKIIADYKKELEETQAKLAAAEKGSGEEFFLKESIKTLNSSIEDTEKILNEGIESLERQRQEEHKKNQEDFGNQ